MVYIVKGLFACTCMCACVCVGVCVRACVRAYACVSVCFILNLGGKCFDSTYLADP